MDIKFDPVKDIANMGHKAVKDASRQALPDSKVDYDGARKVGDSFLKSIAKSKDATPVYKAVAKSVRKQYHR